MSLGRTQAKTRSASTFPNIQYFWFALPEPSRCPSPKFEIPRFHFPSSFSTVCGDVMIHVSVDIHFGKRTKSCLCITRGKSEANVRPATRVHKYVLLILQNRQGTVGLWDLSVWEFSNQDCPVFMQSWKCSEETARNLDGSVASELRFFSHNMIATVIYCSVLIVVMRFVGFLFVLTAFSTNISM